METVSSNNRMASEIRQSSYLPPIRPLDLDQTNHLHHAARSSSVADSDVSPKTRHRPSPTFPPAHLHPEPPSYHAVSSAAHALTTLGKRASSGERVEPAPTQTQATRYSLPSLSEALRMEDPNSKPKPLDRVPSLPHYPTHQSEYTRSPPTSHPTQQSSELPSTRSESNPTWTTSRPQYGGHIRPSSPSGKLNSSHRGSAASSHYSSYAGDEDHHTYTHQSSNHHASHRSSHDEYDRPRREFTSEPRQNSIPSSGAREPSSTWQAFNQPPHAAENDKVKALKRHFGEFDLEQSLTTIFEASKRLNDFSEHYRSRVYQTSRSGPLPGSTPPIPEIEEMLSEGYNIRTALEHLQRVVNTQQAALAERSREQAAKSTAVHSEEGSAFQDDSRDGGYMGSDPKRRRGRVAPPGRCHSCNRAETPEWRRGPDGARTLCNACGLHYAKLTRKMGANKSNLGNSSLRPKTTTSPPTVK